MFVAAAWWNWLMSAPVFFAHRQIYIFLGMEPANNALPPQMAMGLAFVFGIGYYWVSKNLYENHAVVRMGIIGKLLVFILALIHLVAGDIHVALFAGACGDLLFAILFMVFLRAIGQANIRPGMNPAANGLVEQ